MIANICIYGVGGVGGFFGGQLAAYSQNHPDFPRVHFIARGAHLQAIREKGLLLKRGQEQVLCHPASALENPAGLPPCELFIVAVKSYDLPGAIASLEPILEPDSIILPLLNGVDIYERIRNISQQGIVLPACVYVGTHIEEPGVVSQKGGEARLLLGKDPLHVRGDFSELLSLFHKAGIAYDWHEDPYPAIWSKFMFIAAYGLVTAAYGKSLGEVYEDEGLRTLTRSAMEEIYRISQAKNLILSPDIVDHSLEKAREFPYEVRTSLQRDVETPGKAHEGDLFAGSVIRMAREYGVDIEVTAALYSRIRQ